MEMSSAERQCDKKWPDIRVHRGGSVAVKYAVAETQGLRESFEDAHAVRCGKKSADFWLLDGHRGSAAARWAAPALSEEVGGSIKDGRLPKDDKIRKGFRAVDEKLRKVLERRSNSDRRAGTTVVGALLTMCKDGTYTAKLANAGDSRAVVVRSPAETELGEPGDVVCRMPHQAEDGEVKEKKDKDKDKEKKHRKDKKSKRKLWPAILETEDHKPCLPSERARIEAAGGSVDKSDRLDGRLSVSRGLGDFCFKADQRRAAAEQKVSCMPDIYEVSNLRPGALLILGCDGLWDVVSSEMAAQFAHHGLGDSGKCKNVGEVATALVRAALARGSTDNVSVLVAQLTDGKSWENTPDEQVCPTGASF
mmetsp:Transcript_117341/g.252315  ORF Transcript_117341/g.252315 Transcript_117341/m.252315 type:complete len:364 (+) Transcript_117341:115-1206(+)